eukprot:3028027-Prymnesium_polylepis.1
MADAQLYYRTPTLRLYAFFDPLPKPKDTGLAYAYTAERLYRRAYTSNLRLSASDTSFGTRKAVPSPGDAGPGE